MVAVRQSFTQLFGADGPDVPFLLEAQQRRDHCQAIGVDAGIRFSVDCDSIAIMINYNSRRRCWLVVVFYGESGGAEGVQQLLAYSSTASRKSIHFGEL